MSKKPNSKIVHIKGKGKTISITPKQLRERVLQGWNKKEISKIDKYISEIFRRIEKQKGFTSSIEQITKFKKQLSKEYFDLLGIYEKNAVDSHLFLDAVERISQRLNFLDALIGIHYTVKIYNANTLLFLKKAYSSKRRLSETDLQKMYSDLNSVIVRF